MDNVIKTAGVLVFLDNKVLLVRHGKKAEHLNDVYGLPAGRIEEGETAVVAASRELFEETGLKVITENLIKVPEFYTASIERKGGIKNFSQENFLCKNWEGELKANDETIPEWIIIDELKNLELLPNVEKMIFDALKLK